MSQTLQAIRGMNDILPDHAEQWEQFEELIRDWLRAYDYRPIRMPLVEPTPLFTRAIGEVTDIVEKEMYSFEDRLNGEQLTLRPEGTASCLRAVLQHNLLYDGPKRLWYMGPMFRHERPQQGRYRQFHQVGVEALGFAGPDIDAEQIAMCSRLWDDMGLEGIRLEINSLGQLDERSRHRAEDRALQVRADAACPDRLLARGGALFLCASDHARGNHRRVGTPPARHLRSVLVQDRRPHEARLPHRQHGRSGAGG